MTLDVQPRSRKRGPLRRIGRAVGRIIYSVPRPRALWPDVKGIEAIALAAALGLMPLQRWMLMGLSRVSARLRRRRGRRGEQRPVQVLHVTCSFDLGGTQRQIMNVCRNQQGSPFVHDAAEIFPEQNFLYRQDAALDMSRYSGRTLRRRTMGRLTAHLSTRSAQVVQIYKLAQDFRALRPDVVVAWGHEMCVLAFLAAALERVPHIVFCIRTFNPAYGWTTPRMAKLLRAAHRRMQPLVSGVVTNSTLLREDYARWLDVSPASIRVCANGVDAPAIDTVRRAADRSRMRTQLDIAPESLVLLNVGRFSLEKGQLTAMKANVCLFERYGDRVVWLLCGDGPCMGGVKRYVAEREMRNVRFAGRVDDVAAYLAAADIFVMPSDFEGMPNAMMEAMAYGLPCVSTDRSGALDIARDGIEALYCRPGAADELAERVIALVDDPELRARIGRSARERLREFSVARAARAFDACLLDIVGESSAIQVSDAVPRTEVAATVAK